VIPLIGFLAIYIPESTKYLLEKGKYDMARSDIEHILRFNKASPLEAKEVADRLRRLKIKMTTHREVTIKEMIEKQKTQEPGVFAKLKSDKNLIHNMMMMNLVWIASGFIFFLLGFLVKYMPGDIYFNSITSGLSSFAMLLEGKI
jgi:hypothetical protein